MTDQIPEVTMTTFAVLYEYTPHQEKILEHRPAHRKYLQDLLATNKLVAAGPITDDSGSLIVYHAADEAEVQRIIENDPFHKAGIFISWQIKPWRIVFGNRSLLPDGGP
jgi:uncharacterized protein YciI